MMNAATDRPWMTALEMQFAAMKLMSHDPKRYQVDLQGWPDFAVLLKHAETYSWDRDATMAVYLASKTIPGSSKCERHNLPGSGIGWWWFEIPLQILPDLELACLLFGTNASGSVWFQAFTRTDYALEQGAAQVNGTERERLLAERSAFLHSRNIALIPLYSWSFDLDRSTVDEFTRGASQHPDHKVPAHWMTAVIRLFIAGCAWLQQRVVSSSLGHVERHRRKQLAREHNVPIPSDVKVIQLRRTEPHPHQNGDAEFVDWSCRWIVNGHWRNQPYKDERKLIYILPYVKGPDDKPLKVPTHTVYEVSR